MLLITVMLLIVLKLLRYEVIGDNQETSEELLFSPKRSRLSTGDFKILSGFAIYCIPPFALFTEGDCAIYYL